MRIITGQLGGRVFDSPHSRRTHPMSDKVRGALFNTLGDITGLRVVDAFAGSGALGLEAISRGAACALLIESDAPAQRCIEDNIRYLGLASAARLVKANCSSWSDKNQDRRFDLVLADPPFDDLQLTTIAKMTTHTAEHGLFVLNWPGKQPSPAFDDLEMISRKDYGNTALLFFRAVRVDNITIEVI